MTDEPKKKYATTQEWLLDQIEQHLARNTHLTPESLGWRAIRDSSLVDRLRAGGDVTTRKMDKIIAYIANPNKD